MSSLEENLISRFGLSNQTALVWGGSGAIGTEICSELISLGANVIVSSSSEIDSKTDEPINISKLKASLPSGPGKFIGSFGADFFEPNTITDSSVEIEKLTKGKPLDIVIINSGGVVKGISPTEKFEDFDFEIFEKITTLNYLSAVKASQVSLRLMKEAPHPRLGAVCSMSYEGNLSRVAAYRCAKRALHELVYFLVPEVTKYGSHFTVIGWQPGFVMGEQSKAVVDAARKTAIERQMPRGEFQTSKAVAQAIVATLTPACRDLHGAVIPIAAGYPHAGLGMDAV